MNTTKILTYFFAVISIGLAWFLFSSIKTKIDEEEKIASVEARVIEKLQMIREGQIAYQAVYGKYTASWNDLVSFLDTGNFYITERKETIVTLDYGADSVSVAIDTLGTVLVRDSLFNPKKWPNFELKTLMLIPASEGKEFAMWADKIEKSGVMVDVVEVRSTFSINPIRNENNESNIKKPLRFGSRTQVTTTGNWE